jgi:monofunctional biosynthetic peptidoglycan transglycosylase
MKSIVQWLKLVVLAGLGLQLFFIAQIGLMRVVNPPSTAFERSQIWQIASHQGRLKNAPQL